MTQREDRSEKAYRPIGEVADLLRIQPHVLRFWETKFSQIKPLKRNGGRRYYRAEDVRLLFKIRDMLYVERYTLQGVQKLLSQSARSKPPPPSPQEDPHIRVKLQQLIEKLQKAVQEAQKQ